MHLLTLASGVTLPNGFGLLAQEKAPDISFSEMLSAGIRLMPASWWIVIAVCILLVVAAVVVNYVTQVGVIARATLKEAIRQPVFLLLIALGVALNVLNFFVPFFSFGDDAKMMMDCAFATLLVFGLLMASWTASTSIADEIEGKTAMTLLSKPITRPQFILGKYLGILQATFLMLVPIILTTVVLIYFKINYDGKESGSGAVSEGLRLARTVSILPSILLIFMEIAVMTAVSVAISTRLPMVVNLVFTFAIFVIGNLTPVLVAGGVLKFEGVQFMARLIATVLPVLEVFNSQAAIATDKIIPPIYLMWTTIYCICYSAAAVFFALLLFEDRDLA